MELSSSSIEKFNIFQETNPAKNYLVFSFNFLKFPETETSKNYLSFRKQNFLLFRTQAFLELAAYSEP